MTNAICLPNHSWDDTMWHVMLKLHSYKRKDCVINWNETEEIPFNLDVCVYTTWGNRWGARCSVQWWHNIIVRHKNATINISRRAHTVYVIWTETPKHSLKPIKTPPMKQSQHCGNSSEGVLHLYRGMAAAFQRLSNQKMLFCSYAVIPTLKFHHPDLQPDTCLCFLSQLMGSTKDHCFVNKYAFICT